MKKRFVIIIAILFILGGMAGYIGYKMYNKPHPDFASLPADFEITAEELFSSFLNEPQYANDLYTGKILEILGQPHSLEGENKEIGIFIMSEGMFGDEGIRCVFLDEHRPDPQLFLQGSPVRVKGFCAGYNETDVILEKCIWIQ